MGRYLRQGVYRSQSPARKVTESLWALVDFGAKSGFPKRTGHIDTYSFDISMSSFLSTRALNRFTSLPTTPQPRFTLLAFHAGLSK